MGRYRVYYALKGEHKVQAENAMQAVKAVLRGIGQIELDGTNVVAVQDLDRRKFLFERWDYPSF